MKIRLVVALLGLAISLALPISAEEKEEAAPFLYGAIPASPQIAQQLDATNSQFDEAINKHDAVAVAGWDDSLFCHLGLPLPANPA